MRWFYGGKIVTFAALAIVPSLLFTAPAMAEKRIALVVGNSAYQNVSKLDNPRNDAALMADTLRGLGFTLIGGRAQLDLDKSTMDAAVQNFGRQVVTQQRALRRANPAFNNPLDGANGVGIAFDRAQQFAAQVD